jgi:hypothetical protein
MKARSITTKPLNTTNTRPDIIGRRQSTTRLAPMKRQAIMLTWHTDTICSPPNTLKQRQSITLKNTTSTDLTAGHIDALGRLCPPMPWSRWMS